MSPEFPGSFCGVFFFFRKKRKMTPAAIAAPPARPPTTPPAIAPVEADEPASLESAGAVGSAGEGEDVAVADTLDSGVGTWTFCFDVEFVGSHLDERLLKSSSSTVVIVCVTILFDPSSSYHVAVV